MENDDSNPSYKRVRLELAAKISKMLEELDEPTLQVLEDIHEEDEEQDGISEQAFKAADNLIVRIKNFNRLDYSSKREEIANEFDTVLWDGNYDTTLHFDNIQSIRLIQEDEYDQHMDDDEKPDVDFLAGDHYVIFLD